MGITFLLRSKYSKKKRKSEKSNFIVYKTLVETSQPSSKRSIFSSRAKQRKSITKSMQLTIIKLVRTKEQEAKRKKCLAMENVPLEKEPTSKKPRTR
jgi:hypothetical protein